MAADTAVDCGEAYLPAALDLNAGGFAGNYVGPTGCARLRRCNRTIAQVLPGSRSLLRFWADFEPLESTESTAVTLGDRFLSQLPAWLDPSLFLTAAQPCHTYDLPEQHVLAPLCQIAAAGIERPSLGMPEVALDSLVMAHVGGRILRPRPAALWARAFGRHHLSELLLSPRPQPQDQEEAEDDPACQPNGAVDSSVVATGAYPSTSTSSAAPAPGSNVTTAIAPNKIFDIAASDEDFFDALLSGSLSKTLYCLGAGADMTAEGPKIMQDDPGCCRWSPLGAAANSAAKRPHGHALVALLILAKADPDGVCPGRCGWTPLMRAATKGVLGIEACRLLVGARADVRRRHAGTGCTALEVGGTSNAHTSRAIREARDARGSTEGAEDANGARKAEGRREGAAKPACRGKGNKLALNAALINASGTTGGKGSKSAGSRRR